jgi:DNA invertase Pin-like site-specific DNA recombinase
MQRMIYTYNRVSTDDQQSSTQQQESYLKEFCNRKGFKDVISLIDTDTSGGKILFERPQGSKLSALKRGDILIVHKHDRLFRNFLDAVNIINKWFDEDIEIYILNMGETPINLDNYIQEYTLYQLMLAAHLEKRLISQRTRENLKYRKENKKTYSTAPYGWDNVGERGSNGKLIEGKLVRNEYEQDIIEFMKRKRLEGFSFQDIANDLIELKAPTKQGKLWGKGTVKKILDNELNKG